MPHLTPDQRRPELTLPGQQPPPVPTDYAYADKRNLKVAQQHIVDAPYGPRWVASDRDQEALSPNFTAHHSRLALRYDKICDRFTMPFAAYGGSSIFKIP